MAAHMQLTLTGYYGFGNFGDDVILLSLLEGLKTLTSISRVNVLVRDDTYSPQPEFRFPGVHLHSTRPLAGKLSKVRHFAEAALTVWGGGTCLYEPEDGDIRGMESFLRNIRFLRLWGNSYGFLGIGMGALRSDRARTVARRILAGAAFATFRDPASLEIARTLLGGRPTPHLEFCGDPFFLYGPRLRNLAVSRTRGAQGTDRPNADRRIRAIAFAGHFSLARQSEAASFYANQLDRMIEALGVEISMIPMQCSREVDDSRFHARIVERSRLPDNYRTLSWKSPASLVRLFDRIDLLIGMRLHAVALADLLGIPAMGIALQPKIEHYLDAFRDLTPRRSFRLLERIDPDELIRTVETARKERSQIDRTLETLQAAGARNLEVLGRFLESRQGA